MQPFVSLFIETEWTERILKFFYFSDLLKIKPFIECGRTFQEPSGNFSNYLMHINGSTRCEWRITATHGERIKLNITDLDIFKTDECNSDYLEVRDGYWHKSKLIGGCNS